MSAPTTHPETRQIPGSPGAKASSAAAVVALAAAIAGAALAAGIATGAALDTPTGPPSPATVGQVDSAPGPIPGSLPTSDTSNWGDADRNRVGAR